MTHEGGSETRSTISGGTQETVLQGRDFRGVHIGDIVQAASTPVALLQLPALAAGFTGRDTELAQITALLDPAGNTGAVVVSAVAGLAGVGKTALAVHAAHGARQAGWFPGGVLFIDLHGYDAPIQPGQALDALLRALGIAAEHIPPGTEERAALYRSALAQISDPVLVIADNASSEAQVRPLLPGPGSHRVVVTSRHTLAGLDARLLDVGILDIEAGVALLDAALRTARPNDDRIRADPTGAVQLAGVCGSLPLALQITAALLKADPSRTVSEMAEELGDEVQRLEALHYDDGSGTSAPSVAAAFELSYRQLDEITARVFRLLSVNPGPDVSTAAVAALADLPVASARKAVGQLVKAHLVEAGPGMAGRWRMHDLLGLYACQLSHAHTADDGREQARDRLLGYYLDTAWAAADHMRALPGASAPASFTGRDDALAWLDSERPNLIAAVIMAARTGRDEAAIRLPLCLVEYLAWRRRFEDQVVTLTVCRDAARRLGEPRIEAGVLNDLGLALQEMRRFEEATTAYQEAAAICQETGDQHIGGVVLNHLGVTLQATRRFEEAITAHQEAAAILQETGDQHSEGRALGNLATALGNADVGRFEEAITVYQKAAAIFKETGDQHLEGMTLSGLGDVLRCTGRIEEAITAHQKAAAIFKETGDQHSEGIALNNLGLALWDTGQIEEAITAHQKAAAIFKETGDQHLEGMALGNLAVTLGDKNVGRFEEAISVYQNASGLYKETGDRHREGKTLIGLGMTLQYMGRIEEAITTYQNAVAMLRETGDRHREGRTLIGLGDTLRLMDQIDEAITAHQDAAEILREIGDRHGEYLALTRLESDRAVQET